jgi:hypothetical protein
MSKIAMELKREDQRESERRERIFVLLGDDGGIVGVVGPVSSAPGSREEAFAQSGYSAEDYPAGQEIYVSAKTIESYARSWGVASRPGLLRAAREICARKGVPLSIMATRSRFDYAIDRELAAALKLLWHEGDHCVIPMRGSNASDCVDEACQVGPFVFCVKDGNVTTSEFVSVADAERHLESTTQPGSRYDER